MTEELDPPAVGRRTFLVSTMWGAGVVALQGDKPGQAKAAEVSRPQLTASATEGPYYLHLDLMRAHITEGLAGTPLDIAFTVLDETGRPYGGASVDVWHCDAQGRYSGFEQAGGKTFLRGTQPVAPDGSTVFHSIYPGWYRGRTAHIHFKIKQGAINRLTSQFFLPDTLSEFLYTQVPAYRRAELRDTLNSTDGIAIGAGPSVAGSVRESKDRYLAALTVRVDSTAQPLNERPHPVGRAGYSEPLGGLPPDGRHGPDFGGPPLSPVVQGDRRVAALLPDAPRVDQMPEPPPRD